MKKSNIRTVIIAIAALAAGVLIGWMLSGSFSGPEKVEHNHSAGEISNTIWTCSMHPQIRQHEPGVCPICGMDLIPLKDEHAENTMPMAVSMSPTAMQLANVQTMVIGYGSASKTIRLNGKVQADERLLYTQSSHIAGRIEKLMVNFTGDYVAKGQVIATIYSPDLVTAQEELFEARRFKDTQPALFQAAKEKLKNWKLTEEQISRIMESDKAIEQFPVLADVSGYVSRKLVNLGDYIRSGQAVYEIADLSKVWVLFDVYESDMTWIRKGDKITYTVPSLPGEMFSGTVAYIDPVIDPVTRVAKARVEAGNARLHLKPEMFASGSVEFRIKAASNTVIIPKTAVLWTGRRSLVYVKNTTAQGLSFIMREITLGAELDGACVVESGLQPGEEIAVNGTFSIDAAAQLAGKPSMMNPEGGDAMTGDDHGHMDMRNAEGEKKE